MKKGFTDLHSTTVIPEIKFQDCKLAMEMMHLMYRVDKSVYWFCYHDRDMDDYFVDCRSKPYFDDERFDQVGDTY